MARNSCGTENLKKFLAEVNIHFRGLRNISMNPVLTYPEISVCLNCGKAKFSVPKDELELLAKFDTAPQSTPESCSSDNQGFP